MSLRKQIEEVLRAYNNHVLDGNFGDQLDQNEATEAILKAVRECVPDKSFGGFGTDRGWNDCRQSMLDKIGEGE